MVGKSDFPMYLELLETPYQLADRLEAADTALHNCHLCGNHCGIDRTEHFGPCHLRDVIYVASYGPHLGEEDVLRGQYGSGTIFFSGCNLHCRYCQNYDISQQLVGEPTSAEELAAIMLELQALHCSNINLVSPTHVGALLVPAIMLAAEAGLRIPLVYNSGGYDAPQVLDLMDGLVDIYLPDMKYGNSEVGRRLSRVDNYVPINQAAIKAMHRQVGDLQINAWGEAWRGLLVRHLVLPEGLSGTAEVVRFLAEEISRDTYLNLMDQYYPAYQSWECMGEDLGLRRRITVEEYAAALETARQAGLHRFDVYRPQSRGVEIL